MGLLDVFKKKKKKDRNYEGASKGRRTSNWITGGTDPNTQIGSSLPVLRERSRSLRRNSAYAHKGIELITNNVVGKGILTQLNNDPSEEFSKLWKEWAYTKKCDYDGRYDLRGLQRMAMDAVAESGEVIIRKRFVKGDFPIQYQILEADFLNASILHQITKEGNTIIQGIEFGPDGKRVAYHLYENHPGSSSFSTLALKSNRVPAEEIYHLYRLERPNQVRGVPWLAPVMIKLKDLDDFEDAALMRQKIAALFVAFVSDISADVDCDDTSKLGSRMVPGLIEHLPPGKTIDFADPPTFDNYKEFTSSHLRAIASGLGITYEGLSGDLADVNFSAGRMGWIEAGRNIDSWRQHIMVNQFLSGVEEDFSLMMLLRGLDPSEIEYDHIPPRRELIDPVKEIAAMKDAVRSGFESRSGIIQSLGRDPKLVHKQISEDNKKADELDLILDTDPRKNNKAGTFQETEKTTESESQQ